MNSLERWGKAWREVGSEGNPNVPYFELKRLYSEEPRRHHNWNHIEECFEEFAEVEDLVENPAEVVIGLAGHDVIYNVRQRDWDNVEQSAEYIDDLLKSSRVVFPRRRTTRGIVLSTKHIYVPRTVDQAFACDIDKAILGKPWERYDQYRSDIRYEFQHVPDEVFNPTRAGILRRFLKRKNTYSTPYFQDKYQNQSKENMEREIVLLAS